MFSLLLSLSNNALAICLGLTRSQGILLSNNPVVLLHAITHTTSDSLRYSPPAIA